MAGIALLAGLFLVPIGLLILGNRFRDRGRRARGAFWGGVIGHAAALLLVLTSLHLPPVLWQDGARAGLAFWGLLAGGAAGAIIGGIRGNQPRRAVRADTADG